MRRTSMLFSTHRSRVEQYPNRVSCIERARNAVRLRSMDRVSLRVIQPVCSRGVTGILDCIPLVLSSSEKRGCAIKCSLAGGADVTYGHRVAVFLYSSPKPNVVNAPTFATILLLKDWRPAGARQQWSNSVHHCPAFSTMASSPLFPPPPPRSTAHLHFNVTTLKMQKERTALSLTLWLAHFLTLLCVRHAHAEAIPLSLSLRHTSLIGFSRQALTFSFLSPPLHPLPRRRGRKRNKLPKGSCGALGCGEAPRKSHVWQLCSLSQQRRFRQRVSPQACAAP